MRKPRFAAKYDPRFPHVQIYLQFTYARGKFLRYYTGVTVPKEYWNKEKECAIQARHFMEAGQINIHLNKIKSEAELIAARSLYNKSELNNGIFKNELDTFLGKRETMDETVTFFRFFESFIKERSNNPNYSKSSIKVYNTAYNHLKDYAANVLRKEITFADFNHAFFSEYSNYLFNQGFGNNYVHKLTSTLTTLLNEADRRDISPDLKIKSGWLVASREEPPAIYLTESELKQLLQFDLSENQRLARVRDLFLIGCYTGLRFSDFTKIKPGNFRKTTDGKEYIEIVTQKTGIKVSIPVKSELREIMARNGNQAPRAISNQKFNIYLKELGELVGLDEPIMFTKFENGQRIEKPFLKYELVTTHTARRSFATNAYKANVPVKYIMAVTGHKTEREFYKYIRINPDEHAMLVSNNPFFN